MKLLKVVDGKLEVNNFYLYSDIADYAGSSIVTKDVINNTVNLISNTAIERPFNRDCALIEIRKENWSSYSAGQYVAAYLGLDDDRIFGIKDDIGGQNEYWRILLDQGYIQVYCSPNGVVWTNKGGILLPGAIVRQGFKKLGDNPFTLKDYKVYKSPYITIQNFPENTIVRLKDSAGNILKTKLFDSNMEAKIILDNNLEGTLEFKDPTDTTLLFGTDLMSIQFGDIYILSPYEIEVIYKGMPVDIPTMLDSLCELVTIENVSTGDTYTNFRLSTTTVSGDLIQLSIDGGVTFAEELTIASLGPGESLDIIVQIIRAVESTDFMVKDFQLLIE